jgi:hypothetical protein
LNRLGVSVAADIHDRLVTDVAEEQHAKPLCEMLPQDVVTLVSTDNADFLQSHAAVYCGDQSRSTHVTTIQVVQPVPSLKLTPAITAASKSTPHPTLQLKRLCSASPANSPHKHGKVGPKRRRTVQISPTKPPIQPPHEQARSAVLGKRNIPITHFSELSQEVESRKKLHNEAFAYFLQKLTVTGSVLKSLREYILPTPAQLSDNAPSLIHYLEILDENADSQETMAAVSELVLEKLSTFYQSWVMLVGDGKTYEHLQRVKLLYGPIFEKLLIFPGDWHLLKNFQPVLMKGYYYCGLKDFAKRSGYKGETLNSLEKCSHFKRTHSFLLQLWEAMFTELISFFVNVNPQFASLQKSIHDVFSRAVDEGLSPLDLLLTVQHLVTEALALQDFTDFVAAQSKADDTFQLWSNFVLRDCFCYICLFIAIRTSNWELRVSSIKNMAPLFAAYDRPYYQKLVPNHLADLSSYGPEILSYFRSGAFTVKVKGGIGHAVALDEAHEMCINKDIKMAVARPTQAYLKKTNSFLPYRIKAQKQLEEQLFPPTVESPQKPSPLDTTTLTKKWDDNVMHMRALIKDRVFVPSETKRGVVNVFTGDQATVEQAHDLLNAREIGEQHYLNYVSHHILKEPSTKAPVRKKRLLTMAPKKITKSRMSQKEKEERDTNKYLRRRLAWCNRTGKQYDEAEEQYSLLPRAISDADGNPHKGAKSKWMDKLQLRYNLPNTTPFTSAPPWIPEVVIIDAMFAINTNPLRQHKTMEEYAYLLFRQCVLPHFCHGTREVHFVFDHPGRLAFNPKDCEHKRRYGKSKSNQSEHAHVTLTPHSEIPRPWREHLECKHCKRAIVEALGWIYFHTGRNHLRDNQRLVLAGCFSGTQEDDAWSIRGGETLPETDVRFKSNAQEADMRVWRHATQTEHRHILVYSPDTDVFNIGMVMSKPEHHYVVQTNLPQGTPKYVDITKLLQSFEHDPDLASLDQGQLGSTMLQLYIVTGCDYISFFSGIGKATFLNIFFQHAEFITGEQSNGHLGQTSLSNGFLSFVRLVGTAYFKRNLATLVTKLGYETPEQLFNSMNGDQDQHEKWYLTIRRECRIVTEDQRPPTLTALQKHWSRSCWAKEMWLNSNKPDQYDGLAPPQTQGWVKQDSGSYLIDWEDSETREKIQATINFLSKGCSCKTGCKTKRCSCQKNERECGAGCECRGCTNIQLSVPSQPEEEQHLVPSEPEEELEIDGEDESTGSGSDCRTSDDESDELLTEIITDLNFYIED